MAKKSRGNLVYGDFAEINRDYLKDERNLKQIINWSFMLIWYLMMGIYFLYIALGGLKILPSLPLILNHIIFLVFILMLSPLAFVIFAILHMHLSEWFYNPDPDIYENGINLQPGYYDFRFFSRGREFIPFSEIEKIIINAPENCVQENAKKITDKEVEEYFKMFPDDTSPFEEVYKEFFEDTIWEINNTIYIMMKNGKRYEYWKDDMKDIGRFRKVVKDSGVEVV